MTDSIRETRQLSLLQTDLDAQAAAILAAIVAGAPVPVPDSLVNLLSRDVVGNKADTPSITLNNTTSEMAYTKGAIAQLALLVASLSGIFTLKETGGTLAASGAEDTIILVNAPAAVFNPRCIKIDLDNMQAGDTIVVKLYERIVNGGTLKLSDAPITYTGAKGGLPGGQTQITVGLSPNRWGFWVTLTQTGGVNRNYIYEYLYES